MSNFVTLPVEDDAFQREILAELLKNEGFEVVECTTAEAAELIIASTGTELRALITDHNLAGEMSGPELAQYARQRYPQMNIVVMSRDREHTAHLMPKVPYGHQRLTSDPIAHSDAGAIVLPPGLESLELWRSQTVLFASPVRASRAFHR
jgi:CheY-like chemotaxis protein